MSYRSRDKGWRFQFKLTGDRLVLSPTWKVGTETWIGTRVFQRVPVKAAP